MGSNIMKKDYFLQNPQLPPWPSEELKNKVSVNTSASQSCLVKTSLSVPDCELADIFLIGEQELQGSCFILIRVSGQKSGSDPWLHSLEFGFFRIKGLLSVLKCCVSK